MTSPEDQAAAAATAAEDQAAAAARNGIPSNEVPKREAPPAKAPEAAGGCDCEARLDAIQRVARTAGYLALIAAAAVIYLLWAESARISREDAKA